MIVESALLHMPDTSCFLNVPSTPAAAYRVKKPLILQHLAYSKEDYFIIVKSLHVFLKMEAPSFQSKMEPLF